MPRKSLFVMMALLGAPACNVVVWADDTEGMTTTFDAPTTTTPTGGGEEQGDGGTSGGPTGDPAETTDGAPPVDEDGSCEFAGSIQPIFTARCGCHGGAQPAEGLSLAEGSAYAALVGVASAQQPGVLRVEAGAPEASWLVTKLRAGPPVGEQMPLGGTLEPAQVDLIAAWIAAGAPESATFACAGGAGGEVGAVEIDVAGPIQVPVGEIVEVAALVTTADGEAMPGATVTWSSSQELALYVDGGGALLGVSPGTAELRAHSGGVDSDPIAVEVVANDPADASFKQLRAVTDARCAVSGCHVDGVEPGDLRFDRDDDRLWEELLEDEAEQVDMARVEPGAPESSYVVHKLVRTQPGEGAQMPIGGAPMAATEVQVIVRWILAGAPQ